MAAAEELVQANGEEIQSLDSSQTLKAAKVLLRHMEEEAKAKPVDEKKDLFDNADDENGGSAGAMPIWLVISTKRHVRQDESLKPIRVALPHPLNEDPSRTICIVSATPQRAYKNVVASEKFPEDLRNRISRIIDLGKLQKKFKQYEEQRLLYHEHDIFLADDRIINRLPKALGKTFYKSTAKRPIPVILSARRKKPHGKAIKRVTDGEATNVGEVEDIAAEIYKAIGAAKVTLRAASDVSVIIGYANFTPEQLGANIEAVTREVVGRRIAQSWDNVKGIYIKGPQTTTFPIWQTSKLWVNNEDVVANGTKPKATTKTKEKANTGKKRKSVDTPKIDKPKRRKQEALPESNDDRLDMEIALRKQRLAKQKAAAKAAMED